MGKDDNKVINEALNNFDNWLREYTDVNSEGSRKSYKSYVKGAFGLLNKYYGKNSVVIKKAKLNDKKGAEDLILIERILETMREGNIKVKNKPKKTIENYLSGYRMFEEFLFCCEEPIEYKIKFDNKKSINIDNKELKYSKGILRKVFLSRLVTQDRKINKNVIKNQLMYPTRLLNKIFNSSVKYKAKYKSFLNDQLDNIIFAVDKSGKNEISLKDISYLYIPMSSLITYIKAKDKNKFTVYTKKEKNGEIRELVAKKGLSDISLDHINPIDKALTNNNNKYKYLKKLTDIIIKEKKENNLKKVTEITTFVYDKYKTEFIDDKFCKNLFNEIKEVSKDVKGLKILSRSDNSSKSNG